MSIQERVKAQRVRVSMNQKHLTIQAGDTQLVQLENGQYRELPVKDITFHREGEHNESPWTGWYDMSNPEDKEAIDKLRAFLAKNPHLHDDVRFRIRIAGEFDSSEPWPGYDDQDAEQIIAYYNASPAAMRKPLEEIMQYELSRVDENGDDATDPAKLVAIETLDKTQASQAKSNASAGVKL